MALRFWAKSAFSLVELSIVLVILGLLVGGVLSGQSLIRAAELRKVITQYENYVLVTHAFKDKYFALPGDMTNATSFWGATDPDPTACPGIISTGTDTCNGNGNGQIDTAEVFRFWQHLANAGLIEGKYDAYPDGDPLSASTRNSPSGKIGSSLWLPLYRNDSAGTAFFFAGTYGNTLLLGGAISSWLPGAAILKPEEMWNIDTKLDDGKPATGKIVYVGYNVTLDTCTDTAIGTNLAANYLLSSDSILCNITFRNQF